MSDTSDTGTRDTGADTAPGDTGDTGDTGDGTVEAGPPEEVILVGGSGRTDVTDRPDDAFPPGSQVPDQNPSTGGTGTDGRRPVIAGTRPIDRSVTRPRVNPG